MLRLYIALHVFYNRASFSQIDPSDIHQYNAHHSHKEHVSVRPFLIPLSVITDGNYNAKNQEAIE